MQQAVSNVRNRHVNVSPNDLVQELLNSKRLLESQRVHMAQFASALSTIMSARSQATWRELKRLYDPLDPDRDSIQLRRLNAAERARHEREFLALLNSTIDAANFEVLPRGDVLAQLKEKVSVEGVKVSVDQDKYEFIRVWTRGRARTQQVHWTRRASKLLRWARGQPDVQDLQQIYPRCLVACKQKDQISLKVFKNVEDDKLELLLPDIKIDMSNFDRNMLYGTLAVTTVTFLMRMNASFQDNLALGPVKGGLAAIIITAGFLGYRLWDGVSNNRHRYLARYHKTLYFQNVASNRSALALLIDRAAEEEFAETLLAYFALVTSPGSLTHRGLAVVVEDQLLRDIFGVHVQFDTEDAVRKLHELNLIANTTRHSHFGVEAISAIPLPQAAQAMQSMTARDMRALR
ncbi:uncharacterized protein MONBRDRAFT_29105 [Monosiga brevicollis MX1]|uniref:Uncharacterized protein n=1 Tax=Monosiga brevicollis TaxID=81824 RepID=A9VA50_MONBE|nr:uncharacterized protein MONBRDRAFT_29105 [Monosiga brevicollis MX1]EDQ85667.1 predicted protein [Monosiga brevicollis MX1]|eukprot:XP_001749616.1 hypothetical protein [Monosiga brevicollis MX1]